jgi:hypothetical protein
MTYQTYTDHHIKPRTTAPADECETMRLPRADCGCPECCASRYPADDVESDGGEHD